MVNDEQIRSRSGRIFTNFNLIVRTVSKTTLRDIISDRALMIFYGWNSIHNIRFYLNKGHSKNEYYLENGFS